MIPLHSHEDRASWDAVERIVERGGVVALPFERLFGLAADALNAEAVARVAATKGRPPRATGAKPIPVIAPDMEAVLRITTELPPLAELLAERYWPGPMTLLLRAADDMPPPLVGSGGLIGVRIPGPCPAAELAKISRRVLTATSANHPGAEDARSHEDLSDLSGPDLLVRGSVPGPPGSTVIDASGKLPIVIRSGIISIDEENL